MNGIRNRLITLNSISKRSILIRSKQNSPNPLSFRNGDSMEEKQFQR